MTPVACGSPLPTGSIEPLKNPKPGEIKALGTLHKKALKALYEEDVERPSRSLKQRVLKRTASAPELERIGTITEIAKKDGSFWRCVRRYKNPAGSGYIYEFQMREEYDVITVHRRIKKIAAKLDSDEISPEERENLHAQLQALNKEVIRRSAASDAKIDAIFPAAERRRERHLLRLREHPFTQLGYAFICREDSVIIRLPDKEALEGNWQQLRLTEDTGLYHTRPETWNLDLRELSRGSRSRLWPSVVYLIWIFYQARGLLPP